MRLWYRVLIRYGTQTGGDYALHPPMTKRIPVIVHQGILFFSLGIRILPLSLTDRANFPYSKLVAYSTRESRTILSLMPLFCGVPHCSPNWVCRLHAKGIYAGSSHVARHPSTAD